MFDSRRLGAAIKFFGFHLAISVGVATLAAFFVFGVWYPHPYRELAGGRELFWLMVCVDVICGPILTLVLFNPGKTKKELIFDFSVIGVVQFSALLYGLFTVWLARPLYLVCEVDRFKVIALSDVNSEELLILPKDMRPKILSGPKVLGIRDPKNSEERNKVLFESLQGGRDFGERPEFYEKYEGDIAKKSMLRARRLESFSNVSDAERDFGAENIKNLYYLPVVARQDWIAVLDMNGNILGFLKGNGF